MLISGPMPKNSAIGDLAMAGMSEPPKFQTISLPPMGRANSCHELTQAVTEES